MLTIFILLEKFDSERDSISINSKDNELDNN